MIRGLYLVATTVSMIHRYDDIVVGSCLPAVIFAFVHNYPIVFTAPSKPFRFDYFEPNLDLSCIKLQNSCDILKSFESQTSVGLQKILLWERLIFLLSLDSKVILSNLCSSLRRVDNKIICANQYSKIAEIEFGTCHYFHDKNSTGFINDKNIDNQQYLCYDWVAFNKGGKHNIDYFETDSHIVSKVWFYPSDRIHGNTPVKDACVLSILSESELNNFDNSETMIRFRLIHEMESHGMRGPSNGYGPNGKQKYYKFRTSSICRQTHKLNNEFKSKASYIKVKEDSEKDLLPLLPQACLGYDRFLRYL